jgi:hypothetical protein
MRNLIFIFLLVIALYSCESEQQKRDRLQREEQQRIEFAQAKQEREAKEQKN